MIRNHILAAGIILFYWVIKLIFFTAVYFRPNSYMTFTADIKSSCVQLSAVNLDCIAEVQNLFWPSNIAAFPRAAMKLKVGNPFATWMSGVGRGLHFWDSSIGSIEHPVLLSGTERRALVISMVGYVNYINIWMPWNSQKLQWKELYACTAALHLFYFFLSVKQGVRGSLFSQNMELTPIDLDEI